MAEIRDLNSQKVELDAILDDQEKLAIQMLADNPIQYEALKKVLLHRVYQNGMLIKGKKARPQINYVLGVVSNAETQGFDNETIGRQIRAMWEGIRFVELAIDNILAYKKLPTPAPVKPNPAK